MVFNRTWLLTLLVPLLVISLPAVAGPGKDLRQAAKNGDIETVRELLDEGVDPNAQGKKGGGTPLIKASNHGHIEIAQLLMFYGADPLLENYAGKSALDKADDYLMESIISEAADIRTTQVVVNTISPEAFTNLVEDVLILRKWQVETTDKYRITAVYKRGRRAYKVEIFHQDAYIFVKYLRGYSTHKLNYLRNLKHDLKKLLKRQKIK